MHDRDREGNGELAEQAADHVGHEEQRDQYRDQRHGQRDDRKTDLLGALQCGLQRRIARLDVARDVLDHDDRVVDDEPGGNRQCHQRQVVEAEPGEIHHRQGADERKRDGQARDQGRRRAAQKHKDDNHDEDHGEAELELDIGYRRADRGGAVGQHCDIDRRGKRRPQLRQERLDTVDDLDDIGAGLPLNIDDNRLVGVHPRGELGILSAFGGARDIRQLHRRAVPVSHDQVVVVGRLSDLIVGVDRVGAARPVEIAFGRVDIGIGERRAQIVDVEAVGGELAVIRLDAHCRPVPAADADQADPRQLRDFLRETGVGEILDLGQRHRLGGQCQGQDRCVRGVYLGIDRRRRQIRRQQVAGRVDRRLNFLLGHIETEVEAELKGDHRGPGRARRGHLVEPRHLAELHLERRGHRRGHHIGTGARVEGLHLDRRIIDLGQCRQRQKTIGEDADQHDRRHQQRRRHRAQYEDAGGAHEGAPSGMTAARPSPASLRSAPSPAVRERGQMPQSRRIVPLPHRGRGGTQPARAGWVRVTPG